MHLTTRVEPRGKGGFTVHVADEEQGELVRGPQKEGKRKKEGKAKKSQKEGKKTGDNR